jgi:hypothetical protein
MQLNTAAYRARFGLHFTQNSRLSASVQGHQCSEQRATCTMQAQGSEKGLKRVTLLHPPLSRSATDQQHTQLLAGGKYVVSRPLQILGPAFTVWRWPNHGEFATRPAVPATGTERFAGLQCGGARELQLNSCVPNPLTLVRV